MDASSKTFSILEYNKCFATIKVNLKEEIMVAGRRELIIYKASKERKMSMMYRKEIARSTIIEKP